jgi:NAD(P)H-dependent flavin oxidoreductase YrpB (nitropropane dioxygenase family)
VINGVLPCGQSAGLIEEVERAGDVVAKIAGQAAQILSRLARRGY